MTVIMIMISRKAEKNITFLIIVYTYMLELLVSYILAIFFITFHHMLLKTNHEKCYM